MAVDSIDGGGSGESYKIRRKSLEEEREKELSRVEKKYKEDVRRNEEAREKNLKAIHENSTYELDAMRDESDVRIAQAKQASESRIRQFEQESGRMADEAKRQYAAKANLLAKNAMELEEQRKHMVQQHESTLKQLEQNRDLAYSEKSRAANVQALKQQAEIQKRGDKEKYIGQLELEQIRQDNHERKEAALATGERDVRMLKDLNTRSVANLEHEGEMQKRAAGDAMARQRMQNAINEANMNADAQARADDITRNTKQELNRLNFRGEAEVQKTNQEYNMRTFEAAKAGNKKLRELETNNQVRTEALIREGETQEHLARQNFLYKRDAQKAQTDKALDDQKKFNESLNTTLNETTKKESERLVTQKQKLLNEQAAQYQADLKFNKDIGQKQLDRLTQSNAVTLAEHASKETDGFYRLHQMGAQMTEGEREYVITMRVPEHEQANIRISYQGNQFTISGTRTSESQARTEEGTRLATNSYQSYSQTIPVAGKIDLRRTSKTFENGILTFRVPKA